MEKLGWRSLEKKKKSLENEEIKLPVFSVFLVFSVFCFLEERGWRYLDFKDLCEEFD